MSRKIMSAGIAFAVLGCLVLLGAAVLFSLFVILPYEEREVLTQESFAPMGVNSYRAELSTLGELYDGLIVRIGATSEGEIRMFFNITEPGGVSYGYDWTTPVDEEIALQVIDRGVILVVLTLITPNATLDDLEVRVTVTEIGEVSVYLCCMEFLVLPCGGVLVLSGAVMIVLGLVMKRKDGTPERTVYRAAAKRVSREEPAHRDEDVFDRIRKRNKIIPYICPACDEIMDIDGWVKVQRCPNCSAPVDIGTLEKLIGAA
ncbi:MAG: hypothetical protein QCI82_11935 [Candidatus Thermoplasmatota archaeon]|nr:hypothetical protein [Candidatus Thermoplasmatota archaeon]